jgi:hypothetical protein
MFIVRERSLGAVIDAMAIAVTVNVGVIVFLAWLKIPNPMFCLSINQEYLSCFIVSKSPV